MVVAAVLTTTEPAVAIHARGLTSVAFVLLVVVVACVVHSTPQNPAASCFVLTGFGARPSRIIVLYARADAASVLRSASPDLH